MDGRGLSKEMQNRGEGGTGRDRAMKCWGAWGS